MTLRSRDFEFFPAPATIVNHRDNSLAINGLQPTFMQVSFAIFAMFCDRLR